jgi:recombinational DNA repair protein (RecF pathway)
VNMPAVASLEALNALAEELLALKERHPAAYADLVDLFRRHRSVGYKNIAKLMMGEATPEKLKGVQ